jgi:hypothetical protein
MVIWPGRIKVRGHQGGRHGGRVQLGNTLVPRVASLEVEGDEGAPDATVRCEIRDERPEVVEIVVRAKPGGRGIRSVDMSAFSLDNMAINIFRQLAIPAHDPEAPPGWTATWPLSEKAWYEAEKDLHEARAATRGRPSRDQLERVAALYREYAADGPVKVIARLLGTSERTAARRVRQARDAGLLPQTTPGRKGI